MKPGTTVQYIDKDYHDAVFMVVGPAQVANREGKVALICEADPGGDDVECNTIYHHCVDIDKLEVVK